MCDLNCLQEDTSTSKTSDSTEIMTSFSEPSLITSHTQSSIDDMAETTKDSSVNSDATTEPLKQPVATCFLAPSLMTETTPLTQSSNETPSSTEAIIDVVETTGNVGEAVATSDTTYESMVNVADSDSSTSTVEITTFEEAINDVVGKKEESVATSDATNEPLATVDSFTASTELTPLTQSSTSSFIGIDMVETSEEGLPNSDATNEPLKQSVVTVEGLDSFTETTICFLTSSLMTHTTQSSDETFSSTETITDVAEITGNGKEAVATSDATYEPLTTVEKSDSFSTSTDSTPLTQCSQGTTPITEAITDVVGNTEETVATSNATNEPPATVEGSSSFTTSTDSIPLTRSSVETASSTEAITDVAGNNRETLATSDATYEQLAIVGNSDNFITRTEQTPLAQSSISSSGTSTVTDTVETTKEGSDATNVPLKQPVVTLEGSDNVTETTTYFLAPSLMTDTTPLTQSSDGTPSPTEAITVAGSDSFTSSTPLMISQSSVETPSFTEASTDVVEITSNFKETVATSEITYEPLATVTVDKSDSFTASSDSTPLTQSSVETASSTEVITNVKETTDNTDVTIESLKQPGVIVLEGANIVTDVTEKSTNTLAPLLTADPAIIASPVVHFDSRESLSCIQDAISKGKTKDVSTNDSCDTKEDADHEALGLLPVKRPLSFQPGSHKNNLITLDCACECEWCEDHVLNRPHTKASASCLLNKERDWLNDDFFFLLHGDTSKSHSKHHNKKRRSKNSQNGQVSQKSSNERAKQAASPASYPNGFPKPAKKNIQEKDWQNNECFIPHHTSRCFFLTPDKHRMKSYAVPTKTQSSLLTITRAQTPSKGLTANEQRVGKSYSGATTTKSLLPNNLQATQKIKSYAVATKHAQTASPPTRVQVLCSSDKSNSNGKGKGKKTAHRAGSNQHQTNGKTNATLKSSGKKWPRPPRKQEGTFKQRSAVDISTHLSSTTSSTRYNETKTTPVNLDSGRKPNTEAISNSRSYSWRLKHGGK